MRISYTIEILPYLLAIKTPRIMNSVSVEKSGGFEKERSVEG